MRTFAAVVTFFLLLPVNGRAHADCRVADSIAEVAGIIGKESLFTLSDAGQRVLAGCKAHRTLERMLRECFPQDPFARCVPQSSVRAFLRGVDDVMEARNLGTHIGYLRISRFSAPSQFRQELRKELSALRGDGVDKLIVDLRGNLGGFVNSAVSFLDLFSTQSDVPYITRRNRGGNLTGNYISRQRGPYADWQLAILVDFNTASASEIVVRTLQLQGVRVFGIHTRGKSTMQNCFLLRNGDLLFISTSRFYFADGGTLRYRIGIQPDEAVFDPRAEIPETINPENDVVVFRARQYLLGRK